MPQGKFTRDFSSPPPPAHQILIKVCYAVKQPSEHNMYFVAFFLKKDEGEGGGDGVEIVMGMQNRCEYPTPFLYSFFIHFALMNTCKQGSFIKTLYNKIYW